MNLEILKCGMASSFGKLWLKQYFFLGTNLQALIDYTQNASNQSKAEIVLVFSNVPDVEGLKRAERSNIPTKVSFYA